MSLRIGFDVDGVLADFESAFLAVEQRLFGPVAPISRAGNPEEEPRDESDDPQIGGRRIIELRRRRDAVWAAIHSTPDFWTTLKPTDEEAVPRIHSLMRQHRWEVFFITQRPATEGDTVQRQTQQWLVAQGFDLPSVLVIPGSRGAAAGALRLDYHVDDSAKNCIDVKSESTAKPLLILDSDDEKVRTRARRLGIGTAASIGECLSILEEASLTQGQPRLLHRLAQIVGWV
jgi:hypothetical protein